MSYLLDTGVLLRLVDEADSRHLEVRGAVEFLATKGESLLTTTQNIAEFYNVATRPVSANGLGQPADEALRAIQASINPLCRVLREHDGHYDELQRLLGKYQVIGKQVHDARIAASMLTWGVAGIVTLNEKHFVRFESEGIRTLTPEAVLRIRAE